MFKKAQQVFSVKKLLGALIVVITATGCNLAQSKNQSVDNGLTIGQLEAVVELPFRPGNVAATKDGRVFSTVHPFAGEQGIQLLEVTGQQSFKPWPSEQYQSPKGQFSDETIDTPLGITKDNQGGLWIVDIGQHIGKTRIWGFDINSGKLITKIDLPTDIVPADSFVQDLAVDRQRGWVYLADLGAQSILAVEISTQKVRRFTDHMSLNPEASAKLVINGQDIMFDGKPANSGINPITLSADGETLFYGAMVGESWYSVASELFRNNSSDALIAQNIVRVGAKPVSDGASTDSAGNHYITNLNDNGIDKLTSEGVLTPLIKDARLDWPDNVAVGDNGWLYISVNQLHKSPHFSGSGDLGIPPYYIYRVWANAQ